MPGTAFQFFMKNVVLHCQAQLSQRFFDEFPTIADDDDRPTIDDRRRTKTHTENPRRQALSRKHSALGSEPAQGGTTGGAILQ